MLVYQGTVPGPNASAAAVNVAGNFTAHAEAGDRISSAMVLLSSNVNFPVGTNVLANFSNVFAGQLTAQGMVGAGLFLMVSGSDLSNTTILLTVQRP